MVAVQLKNCWICSFVAAMLSVSVVQALSVLANDLFFVLQYGRLCRSPNASCHVICQMVSVRHLFCMLTLLQGPQITAMINSGYSEKIHY